MLGRLNGTRPFAPRDAGAHPDAVVVLGCKANAGVDGALHRRAHTAARAFYDLRPKVVIASGGRRWKGVAEATALRDMMRALGVPEHLVVRELWSLTTMENALYTAELMRAASLRTVVLVTSDWHVERALTCFSACGVQASALAARAPLTGLSRRKRYLVEKVRTHIDRVTAPLWFET